MKVPLVIEMLVPRNCGFSGEMDKEKAVKLLRLYADMIEKDAEGLVRIKLAADWDALPEFVIRRYSHY